MADRGDESSTSGEEPEPPPQERRHRPEGSRWPGDEPGRPGHEPPPGAKGRRPWPGDEEPASGQGGLDQGGLDQAGQGGGRQFHGNFNQIFYGAIDAREAVVGLGYSDSTTSDLDTGRQNEAEVAVIVASYVEPARFQEAVSALRDEHVIVLVGPEGSGRRAAAIALLREVTEGPLVALAPADPVSKVAKRGFDKGTGYVIAGKSEENLRPEMADHTWRNLRNCVREAGAHLVVTAGAEPRGGWPGDITGFPWSRPPAAEVLRALLGDAPCDEQVLASLEEALGDAYVMASLAKVGRRLAAGESTDSLLEELEGVKRQQVADWLDDDARTHSDVLEMAGLAFSGSVPERTFESLVKKLAAQWAEPPAAGEAARANGVTGRADTERPAEEARSWRRRRSRERDHPLISVERVPHAEGSGVIRCVTFREPEYRALVIDELWSHADAEIWDPIQDWLNGVIAEAGGELILGISVGLALLARCAPDEVIESYLDPWAGGAANWRGQTAAVWVLWWMSMDSMAPLALKTSIRWAGQGSRNQRETATLVFGGKLGARFPIEAVRRLCQLGDQGEVSAGEGLAELFATLADRPGTAIAVLGTLRGRLAQPQKATGGSRARDRNLTWALQVLSASDPLTGRPSVATFLADDARPLDDLSSLWAAILCARPWRLGALVALWNVIGALEVSSQEPENVARAFGAALGQELPGAECVHLLNDLPRVHHLASMARNGSRLVPHKDVSADLINVFLAACTDRAPGDASVAADAAASPGSDATEGPAQPGASQPGHAPTHEGAASVQEDAT